MLRRIHVLPARTARIPPARARERPVSIVLSGVYKGLDARDYAVLQDDVQRIERGEFVAHVRVVRQWHPYVQTGTIRIPYNVFRSVGRTDEHRNSIISLAIVDWLQSQSMKLRFAVRLSTTAHANGTIGVRVEENVVQST